MNDSRLARESKNFILIIRSETLKYFGLRSNPLFLVLVVIGLPLYSIARDAVANATKAGSLHEGGFDGISSLAVPLAIAFSFHGANSSASEKRFSTNTLSRLAVPRGVSLLLAKSTVLTLMVGFASLIGATLAHLVVTQAWSPVLELEPRQWEQIVFSTLGFTLFAQFGLALGSALSPTLALLSIGGVLAVIPPATSLVFGQVSAIGDVFSISAVQALAAVKPAHGFPLEGMALSDLSPQAGLYVVAAWGAIAFVWAIVKSRHRQ